MKRRVGELFGKPIVMGNPNEVTRNEFFCVETASGITIKKRTSDGSFVSIEGEQKDPTKDPDGEDSEGTTPASLLLDEDPVLSADDVDEIRGILNE